MLHTIFKQIAGHQFLDAVANGMNENVARVSVVNQALITLSIVTLVAILPAIIIRFLIKRKSFPKKTALILMLCIGGLNLIPGATIYKDVLGFPIYIGASIASLAFGYSYPILRWGAADFLNFKQRLKGWGVLEFLYVLYITVPLVGFILGFIGGAVLGVLNSKGIIMGSQQNLTFSAIIIGTLMQSGCLIYLSVKILKRKGIEVDWKNKCLSVAIVPLSFFYGGILAYLIPVYFSTLLYVKADNMIVDQELLEQENDYRFTRWKT